jgi:hypothetical protein
VALEAVLADIGRRGTNEIVCLRDVAAGGPQPREALERLRRLGCAVVRGNADDWLLGEMPAEADEYGRRLLAIVDWARGLLRDADVAYLESFLRRSNSSSPDHAACFTSTVHRRPTATVCWRRRRRRSSRLFVGAAVLAGGHTHPQLARRLGGDLFVNPGRVDVLLRLVEEVAFLHHFKDGARRRRFANARRLTCHPRRTGLAGERAVPVARRLGLREARVRLLRVGRLTLAAGTVPERSLVDGVAAPVCATRAVARADCKDNARPLADSNDDVLRLGRTVNKIPPPQWPFLALDDQQRLALEHEEVLLIGLPVVHPDRLTGSQHVEADPELREVRFAFEDAAQSAPLTLAPARFMRRPPIIARRFLGSFVLERFS